MPSKHKASTTNDKVKNDAFGYSLMIPMESEKQINPQFFEQKAFLPPNATKYDKRDG